MVCSCQRRAHSEHLLKHHQTVSWFPLRFLAKQCPNKLSRWCFCAFVSLKTSIPPSRSRQVSTFGSWQSEDFVQEPALNVLTPCIEWKPEQNKWPILFGSRAWIAMFDISSRSVGCVTEHTEMGGGVRSKVDNIHRCTKSPGSLRWISASPAAPQKY